MAGGRPTKYTVENLKVAAAMAKLGATDLQIAQALSVAVSTVSLWKVQHKEFSEALTVSKEIADDSVVQSLYKRATGYSVNEVDIRVIEGQIVMTEITKHYPPDPTAMIFWLKNRDPDKWREKSVVEHDATDGLAAALAAARQRRAKNESDAES